MKIFDCFTFFNEMELLELRLMTLYDLVDHFVIVEAGSSHSGNPKEFLLEKNKDMYSKYLDKIRYVKIDLPYTRENTPSFSSKHSWGNENFQRNAIMRGIPDAGPEDVIIISDLDEIPNPNGILEGLNEKHWGQFFMDQKLCYYYVNCKAGQNWNGTAVIKRKLLQTPQRVRDTRHNPPRVVENGGWHYSYLGGAEKIMDKMNSYAEYTEVVDQFGTYLKDKEHIVECVTNGKDLFKRDDDWRYAKKFVTLEEMGHPQLYEWIKKYPKMYKEV
jgi:beta-1,4-mannosyl-glycoprotein beta-1,4-N-acetylglucosaminyltransferase